VTATVGKLSITPGGANVVPGHADFTVDARATTADGITALESTVEHIVSSVAEEEALDAALESTFTLDPVQLDPELMAAVERAAEAEGAAAKRMPSGAGHDAMLVARHVPAAIVFVPSRDGISHTPQEYTAPHQLEAGMRVLAATLRQILRQER
jgi:acetylornithine deacetylase/succinyl-diaminopimelate desuccinylase-like protein